MIARELLEEPVITGKGVTTFGEFTCALDGGEYQAALNNLLPGEKTASLYSARDYGAGQERDWLIGMSAPGVCLPSKPEEHRFGGTIVGQDVSDADCTGPDCPAGREITHFVSKPFWRATASFAASRGSFFQAHWRPATRSIVMMSIVCIHVQAAPGRRATLLPA